MPPPPFLGHAPRRGQVPVRLVALALLVWLAVAVVVVMLLSGYGPRGVRGYVGPQGAQGVQGSQGVQGPAGAQGLQGPAGQ
jgi:hypothetical protein